MYLSRGKSLLELRESNGITKAKCKFQPRGAKPRGAGIAFYLSDEGGIFHFHIASEKLLLSPVVGILQSLYGILL